MTLENGWPECSPADCETLTIPGTPLRLLIRAGQPHAILQAFFRDVNEFIEPADNARGFTDEGSWTEDNTVYTSNHKGATAVDWNWSDHPVKIKDAGWNGSVIIPGDQVPEMRRLLAWYEGMVYWGNDWKSFIDSMHFQMGYNTHGPENFDRVHSFIQRKIRADGLSTYRRGGVSRGGVTGEVLDRNPIKPTSGLTARVLWEIAGKPDRMPLSRYEELHPIFLRMLRDMNANTIDRRAMAIAQLFHESGALYYKREIADGSAYEGRCKDLGNCQPGDGVRFPGRGWIQLTGRAHATGFSGWMHRRGLAPTPTYFMDHPEQMETDENAAQVAVYYWMVSRPQLNALADARNIEEASRAINGTNPKTGRANGIADRIKFYNRALAVNADLLDPSPSDPVEELLMSTAPFRSTSHYRTDDAANLTFGHLLRSIDAMTHEQMVEMAALRGEIWAIQILASLAAGTLPGSKDSDGAFWQARAVSLLNMIQTTRPDWINAALTQNAHNELTAIGGTPQ
jgi:predicted chitinase